MPRSVTITTASSRVAIYIFNCHIGHREFAASVMLFEQYLLSTSSTAQVTPRIQLIGSIIDSQTCDFVSFAHTAIDAHTCESSFPFASLWKLLISRFTHCSIVIVASHHRLRDHHRLSTATALASAPHWVQTCPIDDGLRVPSRRRHPLHDALHAQLR